MLYLALFLATIWGFLWGAYMQFTRYGAYLAVRRTWITVVIGVGVDMLIMLLILPINYWVMFCAVMVLSSIGVIARSVYNEARDDKEAVEEANGD